MARWMFPVFLPLTLWCWAGMWHENAMTDWSQIKGTGPSNSGLIYIVGAFVTAMVAGILQLTVGLLSILALRRLHSWWQALLFGLVISLLLALASSWALHAEGSDGAWQWKLGWMTLVFVPPLMLGAFLSWRSEFKRGRREHPELMIPPASAG